MRFLLLSLIIISSNCLSVKAQSQIDPLERRLGFGAEFGTMGSIGGPYFAMAFSIDYVLAKNFSIGEIVSFIPSADLFQINANTVAKFNIPLKYFTLIPYMGVGFSYGDYGSGAGDDTGFSMAFPLGTYLAIPVAAQIELVGRAQFALISLDYGLLGKDDNYVEVMAGFRFSP